MLQNARPDGWELIQSWRAAVDEWQRARAAYDADPVDEVAWRRLKYAEAQIEALRCEAQETDTDDDLAQDLRVMDRVGWAIVWLLALLAPVAVVGWWWTWR